MVLHQFSIAKAAPKEKPYKLSDGNALHLLVKPNGSKLWRLRYRFGGLEKMLALGPYPEVSLANARQKRDDARRLLADGKDPSEQRKLDKVAAEVAARNTFGAMAAEYLEKLREEGAAPATLEKNRWLLHDLADPLSKRPVSAITPAEILMLLQRIEKTGRRETAHRLRGVIGSVFRFAVATLRANNDPTYALRGALLKKTVKHRAAITDEQQLGALMRSIDEYDGWPTLKAALQTRTPLKTKGDSEVAEVKKRVQALLRAIVIITDGGCVLRHYTEAGACGGYRKDGELILQAEHLITRKNSISFGDLRNIVCRSRT